MKKIVLMLGLLAYGLGCNDASDNSEEILKNTLRLRTGLELVTILHHESDLTIDYWSLYARDVAQQCYFVNMKDSVPQSISNMPCDKVDAYVKEQEQAANAPSLGRGKALVIEHDRGWFFMLSSSEGIVALPDDAEFWIPSEGLFVDKFKALPSTARLKNAVFSGPELLSLKTTYECELIRIEAISPSSETWSGAGRKSSDGNCVFMLQKSNP